jgi:hypothetical protein
LAFKVRVPASRFYQVEVSHRGRLTYPASALKRRHWTIDLSISD